MIVFFASDLLWATKIKSTADALGIAARPVRSVEMLQARLADSPVRALLVDLDASETALVLIGHIRGTLTAARPAPIRIVAFGPHVAVDSLRAAKAAGADTVMARGALAARLPQVLQQLAADEVATPLADELAE